MSRLDFFHSADFTLSCAWRLKIEQEHSADSERWYEADCILKREKACKACGQQENRVFFMKTPKVRLFPHGPGFEAMIFQGAERSVFLSNLWALLQDLVEVPIPTINTDQIKRS